jgi:hypothetical protein
MANDDSRLAMFDNEGMPIPPAPARQAGQRDTLNTAVTLTMGQLFYRDSQGKPHRCLFQFNPTELERSRTINVTRSPTGNTNEEPRVGGRNSAKRKQTRKPAEWEMAVTLRFDAAYGKLAWTQQSPLRPTEHTGNLPQAFTDEDPVFNPLAKSFKDEIENIRQTIEFFEKIAHAQPWENENESPGNADETPPPPYVMLAFGQRAWECAVKSVRIKELDHTPDLYPRRFEVSLNLEIILTVPQNDQGKATHR